MKYYFCQDQHYQSLASAESVVKGDLEGKSRIDSGFEEEEEEEEEEEMANTNKFFVEEKARIHKKRTQG